MKKYVSFAVLWAACAVPAFAGCNKPTSPATFPDGKTAAMEVMMAAKKEMDVYKKEMETYITCERIATKQNDAQKELERVAEAFNVQVRAFKAKG